MCTLQRRPGMPERPHPLRTRWAEWRTRHPTARLRDAAAALGVREVELLASGCGANTTRLTGDWAVLAGRLHTLGNVRACTRNAGAVVEAAGRYQPPLRLAGGVEGALDVSFEPRTWRYGFAVEEEQRQGPRRILHLFDGAGTAVHACALDADGDAAAFRSLVRDHASRDQGPEELVGGTTGAAAPHVDHAGPARSVSTLSLRRVLERARDTVITVCVTVANSGATHTTAATARAVQVVRPWLHLAGVTHAVHVREDLIASAWIADGGRPGGSACLDLRDANGVRIACVRGRDDDDRWSRLLASVAPEPAGRTVRSPGPGADHRARSA